MKPPLAPTLLLATLGLTASAGAETMYVIDKLLVGIHQTRALDSPITRVLPTGTELEVLERAGEIARVRGPGGEEGWVDAGYLMKERPAALLVDELESENRRLTGALARAEEKLAAAAAAPAPEATANAAAAEGADLPASGGELERKLASERLRAGELKARISELQAIREQQEERLAGITGLEARIASLQAELDSYRGASGEGGNTVLAIGRLLLGSKAAVITLLIMLLLAVGGGMLAMDSIQRKRHGGFRL
jgi:hypothetical protein